jgi:hypothetical protein
MRSIPSRSENVAGRTREARKYFFFEKKKQKDYVEPIGA